MSTTQTSLNDLGDLFSNVFGETRGTSPTDPNLSYYIGKAEFLKGYEFTPEELTEQPDFHAVVTSKLISNPKGMGSKSCRRVHLGFLDERSGPVFAVLIVDRFGEGFEEPRDASIETCDDLDQLLEAGTEALAVGSPVRDDAGATEFTKEGFDEAFHEQL
jgi:hypothetical protein